MIKWFNGAAFLLLGMLIWSVLGLTVGKVVDLAAPLGWMKWLVYILMYFILLRFPFGVFNGVIKENHEFDFFPEKFLFSLMTIVFYIRAIFFYDSIPYFMKWHLALLN